MGAVRLLAGTRPGGPPLTYAEHLAVHGRVADQAPEELLDLAAASNVLGRGGAGFPFARKLRTAAESGRPAVVIANGSEGEPASRKDRTLLAANPHLVLDGLQLAARAVRARKAVICVHEGGLRAEIRRALKERRDPVRVRVSEVPDRYVSGEASALVRHLAGGPALPTTRTVAQAKLGILVQNVETLASFALLARLGAARFGEGTQLLTVRGAVRRPAVVEVPVGIPVREALDLAGGPSAPLAAVLAGGYYGAWLPAPAVLDVELSQAGVRAAGGSLGAGLLVAFPERSCGLDATAAIARYLADQSARQCGPCLNGLPAIAGAVTELADGTAQPRTVERLERWCGLVKGRGACSHPDGAVNLVRSALRTFAADVERHLAGGCGRTARIDLGGVWCT